jgi:CelD/BcsL family acetyltransferase involved in cellulose biosynthesis
MITISSRAAGLALAASLLFAGAAFAQTSTAPAAAPAATEKKAEKPRTAASLECSKEADAKGLHGKERKKFRSDCKKEQATKGAPASK